MHEALGLVAGRGRYPLLFCEAARAQGCSRLVVAAMQGEADPVIERLADRVEWLHVGQIGKTIRYFQRNGIQSCVFAGQIKPGRLFGDIKPDLRAMKLLASLTLRNAESIFGGVAGEFEKSGVHVLPATTCLESYLATPGQMGGIKLKRCHRRDVELGWRIAREISRLDIGQTVVVKKGTVLAVEGFEGTDKAILRGGELGRGEIVVVKVAKPNHDMRFDVPCIGMKSIDSLRAAGAAVLCVHARKTLFIDKDDVLAAMDEAGIAVIGLDETSTQSECPGEHTTDG